jgi:tRNA(Ile)-lysidine synthase TilS/MesJ
MSMAQHGRFGGMAVKLPVTVGDMNYPLTMIRPLCCIAENEIRAFIAEQGYRPVVCRCPWGDVGLRSKARDVVDFLCQGNEEVRMNLFRAQFNIAERFLANAQKEEDVEKAADIEDVQVPERGVLADARKGKEGKKKATVKESKARAQQNG